MDKDADSKWVQMGTNGYKWVQMGTNGSRWVQMGPKALGERSSIQVILVAREYPKWRAEVNVKAKEWDLKHLSNVRFDRRGHAAVMSEILSN